MGTNAAGSARVSQCQVGRNTGVINGRSTLFNSFFPKVVICICFIILEVLCVSAAGQVWKWWWAITTCGWWRRVGFGKLEEREGCGAPGSCGGQVIFGVNHIQELELRLREEFENEESQRFRARRGVRVLPLRVPVSNQRVGVGFWFLLVTLGLAWSLNQTWA